MNPIIRRFAFYLRQEGYSEAEVNKHCNIAQLAIDKLDILQIRKEKPAEMYKDLYGSKVPQFHGTTRLAVFRSWLHLSDTRMTDAELLSKYKRYLLQKKYALSSVQKMYAVAEKTLYYMTPRYIEPTEPEKINARVWHDSTNESAAKSRESIIRRFQEFLSGI